MRRLRLAAAVLLASLSGCGGCKSGGGDPERFVSRNAEAVVDHFAKRFLSVPLPEKDRAAFIDFFRGKSVASEPALRELLYLVLSTPEYQLS